jgi:hypothetical protein
MRALPSCIGCSQDDRALHALIEAGIREDNVDVADAALVLEADRDLRQHRTVIERLQAWLSTALSDDAADYSSYIHEAERGHPLVIVHARDSEVVERIHQVLQAHGSRNMRYYGALIVTDLS